MDIYGSRIISVFFDNARRIMKDAQYISDGLVFNDETVVSVEFLIDDRRPGIDAVFDPPASDGYRPGIIQEIHSADLYAGDLLLRLLGLLPGVVDLLLLGLELGEVSQPGRIGPERDVGLDAQPAALLALLLLVGDPGGLRIGEVAVAEEHVSVGIHVRFARLGIHAHADVVLLRERIGVDMGIHLDRSAVERVDDDGRLTCYVAAVAELCDLVARLGRGGSVRVALRQLDVIFPDGRDEPPVVFYDCVLRGIVSLTPHLVAGRETAVAPPLPVVVVAAECRFQLLDARDLAAAVGEDRGADAERHLIDDRLVEDGFLTDFQDVRLYYGIAVLVAVGAESRSGKIPLAEVFGDNRTAYRDVFVENYISFNRSSTSFIKEFPLAFTR